MVNRTEIRVFEDFLKNIGFKRIDGAIYGLLVLSSSPLTSEEIEKTLNLSQSATCTSLKTLSHYGAIETMENPGDHRAKLHCAGLDSLSIVSSILKKRDQDKIRNFKKMLQKMLQTRQNISIEGQKRLESLIQTSEIAESIMNFILTLAEKELSEKYPQTVKKIPKALELLTKGLGPVSSFKTFLDSKYWSLIRDEK